MNYYMIEKGVIIHHVVRLDAGGRRQDYETPQPTMRLRCHRCRWKVYAIATLGLPRLICICGGELKRDARRLRSKTQTA